jgi:hypothetical protein
VKDEVNFIFSHKLVGCRRIILGRGRRFGAKGAGGATPRLGRQASTHLKMKL